MPGHPRPGFTEDKTWITDKRGDDI